MKRFQTPLGATNALIEMSNDGNWIVSYKSSLFGSVGYQPYRFNGDTYVCFGGDTGNTGIRGMSISNDGQYLAYLTSTGPTDNTGSTFVHVMEYQDDVVGYSSVLALPDTILGGTYPNKFPQSVFIGSPVTQSGEYSLVVSNLDRNAFPFIQETGSSSLAQTIGGDLYLSLYEKVGSTWEKRITDIVIGSTAIIPSNATTVNGQIVLHEETNDIYYYLSYNVFVGNFNYTYLYYLKYPYTGGITNAELIFSGANNDFLSLRNSLPIVSGDQRFIYLRSLINGVNTTSVYYRPNSLIPYSLLTTYSSPVNEDETSFLNQTGDRLLVQNFVQP